MFRVKGPPKTERPASLTKEVNDVNEGKKLTITVDANTSKLQLKLKAIAKHAEALANELDAIDNEWVCDCGSGELTTIFEDNKPYMKVCDRCGEQYVADEKNNQTTNQSDKQTI